MFGHTFLKHGLKTKPTPEKMHFPFQSYGRSEPKCSMYLLLIQLLTANHEWVLSYRWEQRGKFRQTQMQLAIQMKRQMSIFKQ